MSGRWKGGQMAMWLGLVACAAADGAMAALRPGDTGILLCQRRSVSFKAHSLVGNFGMENDLRVVIQRNVEALAANAVRDQALLEDARQRRLFLLAPHLVTLRCIAQQLSGYRAVEQETRALLEGLDALEQGLRQMS